VRVSGVAIDSLETKRYVVAMNTVPALIAAALLVAVAVQVVIGGAQLEAAFEAGVIVGAGLLR
jgi:hypothetical protein